LIPAVGHEGTFTIADFVADMRPDPLSRCQMVSGAREDVARDGTLVRKDD